jgi:hypothetical protein
MENWKRIAEKLIGYFVPTAGWIIKRIQARSTGAAAMIESGALWSDTSESRLIKSFKAQLQSCMFTNEVQAFFHKAPPSSLGCLSCGKLNKKCTRSHIVKRPLLVEIALLICIRRDEECTSTRYSVNIVHVKHVFLLLHALRDVLVFECCGCNALRDRQNKALDTAGAMKFLGIDRKIDDLRVVLRDCGKTIDPSLFIRTASF